MSDFVFILIVVLVVLTGVLISVFYIKRETKNFKEKDETDSPLGMIKQDIESLRQKFENGYSKMAHELGQVSEIGRDIKEFQQFLRSPKLRGNIGEQMLRDLLEQVLPQHNFALQYQFQEGQTVDAIIKTSRGIIPIDSKFPMENFRRMSQGTSIEKETAKRDFIRDVKRHIDSITKKYILPREGTVDFALMYVPSEPIYYEIALNRPELLEYGYAKKVYFVSPNSFYYFLKIVMVALEGEKIEKGAKKILEGMQAIQNEAVKFEGEFSTLAGHIEHAKTASERAKNRFEKLVDKIDHLEALEMPKDKEKLQ